MKFIQFDGRDIQESALYCRSTLGAMDVDYSLTPKPHTRRVDGLKERLISEPHKPRPTRLHVPDRQSPHVVNLDARTTLDAFFEALAPSLRPAIEGKSLILTYPAMADASQREDYRKRIKSAASRHFNPRDIAFIEESDAVVEFLLHSGRGIELPSRDQLIPVLDWGSLTCNIALVIPILAGGRTSDVTTGDRPAALATTADCARECGGARIDQLLLQEFLREHDFQCPEQIRNALLPIIEELKVRVSREQRPVHVEVDIEALYLNDELTLPPSVSKSLTFALAPQTLRDKVKEVWHHNIRPVLDRLLERAWENIRGRRRERLSRLNINRSEGLKQIIDQIVLSGGSSNLPGVAELAAEYFDVKRERIVEVGHDFVAAVAVGAAAWRANQLNVLEATHVPASINLLPRPENNLYLVGKSGSSSVRVHEPALILRDHWEEHIAQWHEHEPTTRVRFSCPQYAIAETDSATAGSQEPEAITRGLLQPSQPWEHLKKEIKQQQNQKGARGGWATYIDPKSGQITVELRHQRSETSKVIKQQFHRFTEICLSQASPHTPSVRMSESPTHIEPSTRALGQSQSQSQVVLDFGNSKTIAVSLDNVETLLLAHLPVRQNPPAELLEHAVFDAGNEPSLVERPNESPPGTDFPQAPSQDAKVAHIAMPELPGVDSLGMQRANPPSVDSLPTHPDAIAHLIRFVRHRGMVLDDSIVKALYLSLVVRPFAVMAGPAGVGKSRLARLYGEAFAANSDGHRVAVEPSWLSSESLIPAAGWSRIYQTEYPSPELVVTVLDEFNLAPPERYLAQVLSACEDDGILTIGGHPLRLPRNGSLKLIGTVNIDESTHTLSDKVLDRFSVIELEPFVPDDEFPSSEGTDVTPRPLAPHLLQAPRTDDRAPIPKTVRQVWSLLAGRTDGLKAADEAGIASLGLGLGYRLALDICRFTQLAEEHDIFSDKDSLDIALSSRVLPRLRGDRRLEPILTGLLNIAEGSDYTRTYRRLCLMLERLKQDRYSSYWS